MNIAKGIANLLTSNVFGQKVLTQQQQKKNPCRSRELNPGPLALKAEALPLHHRVN